MLFKLEVKVCACYRCCYVSLCKCKLTCSCSLIKVKLCIVFMKVSDKQVHFWGMKGKKKNLFNRLPDGQPNFFF